MANYNLTNSTEIDTNYQLGLLPQRNQRGLFYQDSSCRSNLANFSLSSENRRILAKTSQYTFTKLPLKDFDFNITVQIQTYQWIKKLGWHFPISSLKTIFTNHIFNTIYIWQYQNEIIAYAICYFSSSLSHIAYVFYNPDPKYKNLPIRLVLQTIIDSHALNLDYCYLGRFAPPEVGYYKRTMPGFEYFDNQRWNAYN